MIPTYGPKDESYHFTDIIDIVLWIIASTYIGIVTFFFTLIAINTYNQYAEVN